MEQHSDRSGTNESVDLCAPFLRGLPVAGSAVTLISTTGTPVSLCSSDALAGRIEELQFELGEGPQWTAYRAGRLVMIPDVSAGPYDEWPVFGAAIRELSVGALFSVPLKMGAVTLGVATLYCLEPFRLSPDHEITAIAIGAAIAGAAVVQAISSASQEVDSEAPVSSRFRREVHQATGILVVKLDTTATLAYARMQAYAFAQGRTAQAVAHDVVTGMVDFEDMTQ